jgi:penicillin amidase
MNLQHTLTLRGAHGAVTIRRMEHGHPHILADNEADMYYGLGYMHALDRQAQMWLTKIIGNGQGSQFLDASPLMIETDKYMRWLDLAGDARREESLLQPETRALLKAYCHGVNDSVARNPSPLEFKLVGYKADEWTIADVLLAAKMIGFVGLASTQADAEKFILQMLQNGVDPARLKELFPAIQEEIPPELVEIVKQVKINMPIIAADVPWKRLLPNLSASNHWAVSPRKTASGKAMLCADPHLGLQLPNIWYVAALRAGEYFVMGATVPGVPLPAIARSPHLAWAATYGTMDLSDFFIEEIKDGKYRHGEQWLDFEVREELIRPKKGAPIRLRVYATEHGLLEGEPQDGYGLSFALSIKKYPGSAAQSVENFLKIFKAKTVGEALDYFAGLTFSPFNWTMADLQGDIGYQLGGLYPAKSTGTSGLLPYRGWDPADDWQGAEDPRRYPRLMNPPEGFIITANNDFNHLGEVKPMTLPMSTYRAEAIRRRLEEKDALTVQDMQRIHYDRYSLQAERFMQVIHPLLPDTPSGRILRDWDLRYEADSLGAMLFENVYEALIRLVFGEMGLGAEAMNYILTETPLFSMLHGNFDAILLGETSVWFGGKTRAELFQEAIRRGLEGQAVRHGVKRKIYINNLFFGGKLPRFLGFDHPLEHIGSRATIAQAQIYRSAGRDNSFAATYRMICDFAESKMYFNLAGGASGQRFSTYYKAGLREWEQGIYQVIEP